MRKCFLTFYNFINYKKMMEFCYNKKFDNRKFLTNNIDEIPKDIIFFKNSPK